MLGVRSVCLKCSHSFGENDRLIQQQQRERVAANAPPALTDAAQALPVVMVKRPRVDLTEIVTGDLTDDAFFRVGDGDAQLRVTRLADIYATRLHRQVGKWIVDVRIVKACPLETRHCTRPFCPNCGKPVLLPTRGRRAGAKEFGGGDVHDDDDGDDDDDEAVRAHCDTCGLITALAGLHWRYLMQIDIRDNTVTLPVMVWGDQGALFFRGIPPVDLWANHASHELLRTRLDRLVASNQVTRMCIQSHVPANRSERVYQVFNTIAL